MSTQIVVGLNGFARSGKDTAALPLLAAGFTRIALADPLRAALVTLNPLMPDGLRLTQALGEHPDWDWAKAHPVYGTEVRELMQRMGTEVARQQWGDTFWTDRAEVSISQLAPSPVVITDVRFPNEAQWCRQMGWPVVRITRPGVGPVNSHTSDQGLPDHLVDAEIANDGTIEQLHDRIRHLLMQLDGDRPRQGRQEAQWA